jgi:hypothetical protein
VVEEEVRVRRKLETAGRRKAYREIQSKEYSLSIQHLHLEEAVEQQEQQER